jgi:two-component system chemotaxis response regulator CheB
MTARGATVRRRPAEPPLRVMIVDDSSVARAILSRMIGAHADFEIVGEAGSADDALDVLRTLRADVILLDVEMPGASGLEALPEILRMGRGARVLIVSSMAENGAETTVQALAQGAADTLPKPGAGHFGGQFSRSLADKLRRIGRAEREADSAPIAAATGPVRLRSMPEGPVECVAVGASTGGLHALFDFLGGLPERIGAPILVTQHLPAIFMPYFARQLQAGSGREARVVADGDLLVDDVIHVAPGDAHLCVVRAGDEVRVRLERRRAPSGCLPSVDPMLICVAEVFGAAAVGVILSGMGRDGLVGSGRLVECGGAILAQDRASAAIWGMPRVVAEAGLASALLPPADLARKIVQRAGAASWK